MKRASNYKTLMTKPAMLSNISLPSTKFLNLHSNNLIIQLSAVLPILKGFNAQSVLLAYLIYLEG